MILDYSGGSSIITSILKMEEGGINFVKTISLPLQKSKLTAFDRYILVGERERRCKIGSNL